MMLVTAESKQCSTSLVFCEHQHSELLHFVSEDFNKTNQKKHAHLDFWLEIVMKFIVGLMEPLTAANENYENFHMD